MTQDLQLRGYADRTVEAYVRAVAQLAKFYHASPDRLCEEQIRLYLLHLSTVQKVARGTHTIALCGIKFFYQQTLGHFASRKVLVCTCRTLTAIARCTLWPQVRRPDARGTLSHESALAFHHLTDVSPVKVHITLPVGFRVRRVVPRHIVLHYADLADTDVRIVEGIPVTTPVRTIHDVHKDRLGDVLVRQAIDDGQRRGELTYDEADLLVRELLVGIASVRVDVTRDDATRFEAPGGPLCVSATGVDGYRYTIKGGVHHIV